MPRIRYLKPTFFTSDTVASLPPLVRLLFQGLWCLADREGLLLDRPQRIRVEIMPYDKLNIDAALTSLQDSGFICRYTSDGTAMIHVSKFHAHQKPHHKEPPSTLHPCPVHESSISHASAVDEPSINHDASRARAGATIKGTGKGTGTGTSMGTEPTPPAVDVVVIDHPSGETKPRPDIFALYEGMGWTIAPGVVDTLALMEAEYDADWLRDAFQMGANARARNLNYMQSILKHWGEHGRDCECMKPTPKATAPPSRTGDAARNGAEVFPGGVQTGTGVVVKSMMQEAEEAQRRTKEAKRGTGS